VTPNWVVMILSIARFHRSVLNLTSTLLNILSEIGKTRSAE
jgi:hypothetical protein